jgi:hypothetical protein
LDPCVCGLESERFFDDNGQWPSFETTRTCEGLLDFANFRHDKNEITRRREWCLETDSFTKVKELRNMLASECKAEDGCEIKFNLLDMRSDMGLLALKTRSQFVDFLTTFIWEATAGHAFNGDNISYFSDPYHSGVRVRAADENGEFPIRADLCTYVFGTTIASLTTVRCPPLLADWTALYTHYASRQKQLSAEERQGIFEKLNDIHLNYKHKLFDLAKTFLDESLSRRVNQRSNVFNPATHSSSVAV